jgi:hypothetical protein
VRPERPFPFFKDSGERSRHCKAVSGCSGVIRAIAFSTAACAMNRTPGTPDGYRLIAVDSLPATPLRLA